MRKRLDAGNQLHPFFRRIVVEFAQLSFRIAAAHIAEIRLSVHLIGILCVQHQGVIAHRGRYVDPLFNCRYVHDRISGAIDHRTEPAKIRLHQNNLLFCGAD